MGFFARFVAVFARGLFVSFLEFPPKMSGRKRKNMPERDFRPQAIFRPEGFMCTFSRSG